MPAAAPELSPEEESLAVTGAPAESELEVGSLDDSVELAVVEESSVALVEDAAEVVDEAVELDADEEAKATVEVSKSWRWIGMVFPSLALA